MPNLLDIRRRIRTVRNTQQITQAMKMVSAAKLRRAQDQALAARPYAERMQELMAQIAGGLDPQALADARFHGIAIADLLARRPVRKRLLIGISSDKGLAGAFNANVIKAMMAQVAEHPEAGLRLEMVGRKGRDFFRRRHMDAGGDYSGAFGRTVDLEVARRLARAVMERFAAGEADEVLLIGNEFKSVIQQRVVVRRLLPLEVPERQAAEVPDYTLETPPVQLLAALVPRYLETQIYRALLESFAAEHAARMNAMAAATTNAGDLIDSLTLNMNRVRQAAITKEIIEVVSGAAALD